MLKKIILTLSVLLIYIPSVKSQSKVGTSGTPFLELSPSVKANGMGQAGMTIVSNNSYYFNPAILGLLTARKQISVSSYTTWSKLSPITEFYNFSVSLPMLHKNVGNVDYYFGAAYYRTKLVSDDLVERTYERGTYDGTGRTFNWEDKSDNVVLSFARTGTVDIAVGGTIKHISESVYDYSATGYGFDVGAIVRYNMKNNTTEGNSLFIIPAIGFSLKNLGADMTLVTNSYSLPKSTSFGGSVTTGITKLFSGNRTADLYKLAPAFDIEKQHDDRWVYRLGVDLSVYEIINLRIGRITDNVSSPSEMTYGFSLSSFQFGKFAMLVSGSEQSNLSGIEKFFYEKVNIEYNFASYDRYYITDVQNYHEIVVNYQL